MLPLCRILTFKYNASIVNYNSDAALQHIATSLLGQIDLKRTSRQERERKLIFVCHSLGGLLVKQALVLGGQSPNRQAIQASTIGIIFLGTPHGGASLARGLAKISIFTDSPSTLLDVLSMGSQSLRKVTDDFAAYYTSRRKTTARDQVPLQIASFCEMHRTRLWGSVIASKVEHNGDCLRSADLLLGGVSAIGNCRPGRGNSYPRREGSPEHRQFSKPR